LYCTSTSASRPTCSPTIHPLLRRPELKKNDRRSCLSLCHLSCSDVKCMFLSCSHCSLLNQLKKKSLITFPPRSAGASCSALRRLLVPGNGTENSVESTSSLKTTFQRVRNENVTASSLPPPKSHNNEGLDPCWTLLVVPLFFRHCQPIPGTLKPCILFL
jgi:hypothetical protein